MRSLAVNLIMQEKITTTKIRAHQAASMVEKLITKAKKNNLASKKALGEVLPQVACKKLSAIAPRFAERNGGYTRISSLGQRIKDGAPMAVVELLDRPAIVEKAPLKKEKKPVKKAVAKKDKKEEIKEDAKS